MLRQKPDIYITYCIVILRWGCSAVTPKLKWHRWLRPTAHYTLLDGCVHGVSDLLHIWLVRYRQESEHIQDSGICEAVQRTMQDRLSSWTL